MSTAQQQRPQQAATKATSELDKLLERSVKYTPFAEQDEIELTFGQVKNFISAKTRKGATATDGDIVKFMMLCKARGLNPWVGDAYLVGYDSQDGPSFSLITSHQALLKRAEAHPAMDGLQSGVIVRDVNNELVEREGDLLLPGEKLVGAWAKLYRKDRRVVTYDALNLSTYDKGRSQWEKDKSGMIVKCAEASVLRKAFPSQLAGLYIQQEAALITSGGESPATPQPATPRTLSDLMARERKPPVEVAEQQTDEPQVDPDPLAEYRAALSAATTEADCRNAYETHGNPERSGWSPEQDKQAVAEMHERIAAMKGGGK